MVFNSNVFLFLFFPVVFALFWLSATRRWRHVLLTAGGYVFYGYCDWRYCFLLAFSSLVSFVGGLMIQRSQGPVGRRIWLIASIAANLGLLGFFKYYDFAASSLNWFVGGEAPPLLKIALPIGISFYTFSTISYLLDVTHGRVQATADFWKYFTYVSLFPQLVAGPIVRFGQIEDDLEHIDRRLTEDSVARGVGFFAVGMVKKAVVADTLALYVNPMLSDYPSLSTAGAWAAALGYTFQLYYDFSGYSDMAVGLGHLFGLRIPQNFNAPYRARSITEFWQRWHISLSTWFRDYVFLPLAYASARRFGWLKLSGWAETMASYATGTLITMLLIGLWHGASWTFVAWGFYHGVLLVLDRALKRRTSRLPDLVFRWLTFLFIVAGWALFRSSDFHMAATWLAKMSGLGAVGTNGPSMRLVATIALCFLAANTLPASWDFDFRPTMRWALASAVSLFVAYLFMNGRNTVFLYYQF
jgi:alginate O-acetyltransferase complex protein AlgI